MIPSTNSTYKKFNINFCIRLNSGFAELRLDTIRMQGVKFCRTLVGPTPTARRGDRAAARSRAGTQTAAERGRARNIIAAKEQRGAQLGQGHR